jgi:hypothetical protein
MRRPSAEEHVRWPAESFYFAVLDGSLLPRSFFLKPTEQLGYLLEPLVPQPLEELHVIFHPLPKRRYLACAIPRKTLASSLHPSTLTLTPESLPPFVSENVLPDRLNLLTGPFTPKRVRELKARWSFELAALLVVCMLLISVGFEQRVGAERRAQAATAQLTSSIYREILGERYASLPLPPPLQLTAELRTLRQTRAAASDMPGDSTRDVSLDLANLLGLWPRSVNLETESLQLNQKSLSIVGMVPSSEQAEVLSSSFALLKGFELEQPSVQSLGSSVRVSVQMRKGEGK